MQIARDHLLVSNGADPVSPFVAVDTDTGKLQGFLSIPEHSFSLIAEGENAMIHRQGVDLAGENG